MRNAPRIGRAATTLLTLAVAGFAIAAAARAQEWKPVAGKLMTRWAKDVNPAAPLPEYPRPTMVRPRWQNLNGLWDCSIAAAGAGASPSWSGKILVPFPVESALSGVGRPLEPTQELHYRRTFRVRPDWKGSRILLHFGAVDWDCRVRVNGADVGDHRGGYDGFSFDVTAALIEGENELAVVVRDPTNTGGQPRGKQWNKPHGIWYTPTSGIWQTVWLEPVPAGASIRKLRITPDAAGGRVRIVAERSWRSRGVPPVEYEVLADGKPVAKAADTGEATIAIPQPRLWTPDDPYLYELRATFTDLGVTDEVRSYFGLRDVRVVPHDGGVPRILLNDKPVFQFGPLDQGFWPDGLYTAPTDEALRFDVEAVKKMGGNMLRKHVKVEPERFYYWCDRLGVLVWQDMPSPFFESDKWDEDFPPLSDEWKTNFEDELKRMIDGRRLHPSIVMWVPFNEGWGQNDLEWAKSITASVKEQDPTRLVNNASGWTDMRVGDVCDIHVYPGPGVPAAEERRAAVLGEFGGLGLPVDGHTWASKDNWGYVKYADRAALTAAYLDLLQQIPPLIADGLCAAVYTQTTDVEIEVNGWLTYDREVWKIDPARCEAATKVLYAPPPRVVALLPSARQGEPGVWHYRVTPPPEGWAKPGYFPDESWKRGRAGFGTEGTPGAIVGTSWAEPDIWLRREAEFARGAIVPPRDAATLMLSIHHDEDAEVYLNGDLAAELKGYTTGYALAPILPAAARHLEKEGKITIAVHCRQTTGGQYIDVGIVEVIPSQTVGKP